MAELKGLLDSAKAKLAGLLGDFPQGFNSGAVAGVAGYPGDIAYLLDTAGRAITGQHTQPAAQDFPGTTDYIAAKAGYPIPASFSGQLGAAVGGVLTPGPGDIGKFAPLLGAIIPGSAWNSQKIPSVDALARNVDKLLYHSGTADDVAGMKYGIEPTNEGSWIREVAQGAVDDPDELLETATPIAWMSDKPDWVKIKVARKLGKPISEVTDADIAEHGHLAIINKKTADSAYRVGPEGLSNGEYSLVTNNKGEQLKAYETPLYGETRDFRKMEPFGVERDEWVSTETIEPLVHLTGDDLVQYLRKVERDPIEDFAARRAGKAKPYREAMGLPMDTASRMQRAQEMGFDTENPVYHGTRTKGEAIDAFSLDKAGSKTDSGYMGKGIYFGNDKTANAYAGHYEFDPGHFPEGGAVYPSYLSLKSPLILEDKIENGRSVDLEVLARDALGLPREATAEQVTQEALRQGYDGAIYSRGKGMYREYVAYNPEQIRSKFAAFDPSKKGSANLLAGLAALGVGTAAVKSQQEKERRNGL